MKNEFKLCCFAAALMTASLVFTGCDKKDVKEAQCLLHDYFFSKTKGAFQHEKI